MEDSANGKTSPGNNQNQKEKGNRNSEKFPIVVFPFLVACIPLLFFVSRNLKWLLWGSLRESLLLLAGTLTVTAFLYLALQRILRNSYKAGFIVSFLLFMFFSFDRLNLIVAKITGITFAPAALMIVYILIFAGFTYFMVKTRRDLANISRIVQFSVVCLFFFSLYTLLSYTGNYIFKTSSGMKTLKSIHDREFADVSSCDRKEPADNPDIYYIILDRYADADTLKKHFDLDNTQFIDYLKNKGFYVAEKSNCNYPMTLESLASSLNMRHVNDLQNIFGQETGDYRPLFYLIEHNNVFRFLKSKGYRIINMGDVFLEVTSKNPYADVNVSYYPMEKPTLVMIQNSLVSPVTDTYLGWDFNRLHYKHLVKQFDYLATVPEEEKPTFVFAHILIPHEPLVFDENGNFVTEKEAAQRGFNKCYRDQVMYANKLVEKTVDAIMAKSKAPPVIILQADEGPQVMDAGIPNWHNASEEQLRYRSGILNALYLPGFDKNKLYTSLTPVNTFRVIFNHYFNTQLDLLPDDTYVFRDLKHCYDFKNVSDKVKK